MCFDNKEKVDEIKIYIVIVRVVFNIIGVVSNNNYWSIYIGVL